MEPFVVLSTLCTNVFVYWIGDVFIANDSTRNFNSKDVLSALQDAYCVWIQWTFCTHNDSKIVVKFLNFSLEVGEEILTIGDGLLPGENTRLVRYSGNDLPSDVTSVSNGLWMQFQYNSDRCCRTPDLEFTVDAMSESGKCFSNDCIWF